jgi:acyl-CoA thioesterase
MDAHDTATRCARTMYDADRASRGMGIEVQVIGPGAAIATLRVRDDMLNGHGICHGGFVFMLADTAFAFACNTFDDVTVAAGADVSFLEPVRSGAMLTATAQERSRRGRSGIYDVTVTDEDGTVVAEFRGRSRSLGQRLLDADSGPREQR